MQKVYDMFRSSLCSQVNLSCYYYFVGGLMRVIYCKKKKKKKLMINNDNRYRRKFGVVVSSPMLHIYIDDV